MKKLRNLLLTLPAALLIAGAIAYAALSSSPVPSSVTLTGTGQIDVAGEAFNFSGGAPGDTHSGSITVGNSGTAPYTISFVLFSGAAPALADPTFSCNPSCTVSPGGQTTLNVSFDSDPAAAPGTFNFTTTIEAN